MRPHLDHIFACMYILCTWNSVCASLQCVCVWETEEEEEEEQGKRMGKQQWWRGIANVSRRLAIKAPRCSPHVHRPPPAADSPPLTAVRHAGRGGGARRWSEKDGDGGGGLRRFYRGHRGVASWPRPPPLPFPPPVLTPDWPRRSVALLRCLWKSNPRRQQRRCAGERDTELGHINTICSKADVLAPAASERRRGVGGSGGRRPPLQ